MTTNEPAEIIPDRKNITVVFCLTFYGALNRLNICQDPIRLHISYTPMFHVVVLGSVAFEFPKSDA